MKFPGLERITIDPRVMGGKPCIRGIRITVGTITGLLASGESVDSVLALYPSLEREDIYAALAYATWRAEESAESGMNAETERTARRFLERVRERYDVTGAVLYGSRARKHGGCDSDADLAVLLNGPPGDRIDVAVVMAGLAFDVMLETGILVDPLPLWDEEWSHPERFVNPALIANIQRDGVRL